MSRPRSTIEDAKEAKNEELKKHLSMELRMLLKGVLLFILFLISGEGHVR